MVGDLTKVWHELFETLLVIDQCRESIDERVQILTTCLTTCWHWQSTGSSAKPHTLPYWYCAIDRPHSKSQRYRSTLLVPATPHQRQKPFAKPQPSHLYPAIKSPTTRQSSRKGHHRIARKLDISAVTPARTPRLHKPTVPRQQPSHHFPPLQ